MRFTANKDASPHRTMTYNIQILLYLMIGDKGHNFITNY
jgi:hypothetical protein